MARIFVIALGLLLILTAACTPRSEPISPTVQGPEIRASDSGGQMAFTPSHLTFTVGQRVRITFINEGTVPHEIRFLTLTAENVELDWFGSGRVPQEKIDEFNALAAQGQVVAYATPGHSMEVEFTPTSAGTFDYRCLIAGHVEMGSGELVVR